VIGWALAAVYLAGYAWGFRWMLAAARRAYANPGSEMWRPDYSTSWRSTTTKLDGMGVAIWSVGVLLVPLGWPLLMAGLWVWGMVVRTGTPPP
jgi:hypothetical protein